MDHRLVRQAAERTGRPLVYYEDYPYAGEAGKVEEALGEGDWEPEVVPLDEAALEAKIAAARCYRSQITSFWADEADMAAHFRAYAAVVGGGNPAERYWNRAQGRRVAGSRSQGRREQEQEADARDLSGLEALVVSHEAERSGVREGRGCPKIVGAQRARP